MVICRILSLLVNMDCQFGEYDNHFVWFSVWMVYLLLVWTSVLLDEGYVEFWIKVKLLSLVNFDDRIVCPTWSCTLCSFSYNLYWDILDTLLVLFYVWKTKNGPGFNSCLLLHVTLLDFKSLVFWNP